MIRYKADRRDNRKAVNGYYINVGDRHIIVDHAGEHHTVDSDTIRQYTGFEDWFVGDQLRLDDGTVGKICFGTYIYEGEPHFGYYVNWPDHPSLAYWYSRKEHITNEH